ncbi:MAG: thiamine pyrophosphate-binding protein [Oscillospiraceae bacterium]|nr:thiamine pyrophosphate-binding protein [Oscillospiraceae bacterium]
MTVSEYIFNFLQERGCDTVYMVSGSSAMWLTDALQRNSKLKAICCHHEQAAAMAADCYGRTRGIPGVCLATIGPGATNAITGVAGAFVDSSPMFVLTGQANSRLVRYEMDTGIRQHGTQSLNLEPIVSPMVKYFACVLDPADIRQVMERAWLGAVEGRPGPVWIDVPVDVQNKPVPEEMEGYRPSDGAKMPAADLQEIAQRLARAEKPLILAGGGVRTSGAAALLNKLCQKLQIPVVTSRGGIDVIASDSPYFVGRPGSYGDRASHFAIQQCDYLLILGSRLSISTTGYYPQRFGQNAYKVMVDIDQKELDKPDVPVDLKLCMELKPFLEQLNECSSSVEFTDHSAWLAHCQEMRSQYPNVLPSYAKEQPLNSYYFTKLLSQCAPAECDVVVDTGSVCNIVSQSWELKDGQRYLISGGLSAMGFWAGAIGAVRKGRQVIALSGDGSVQMNVQEFATLHYNQLPVKLFVYQNSGYMLIRHNQHNYMNDRFLGVGPDSGLETPDFCKVAAAYGLNSCELTADDNLEEKIQEILAQEGPFVCQVRVQEFGEIAPKIASRVMPDGSLKAAEFDDLYPFL